MTRLFAKLTIFLLFSILVVGLLEKEKGLNDWVIESLGEIKDMKFVEKSNLVYTLSTTGLLTLFNKDTQ